MGGGMASPVMAARFSYVFCEDIPDGEVVVPIVSKAGTVLAVRPGAMTEECLAALNEAARLLIDTGRWQPGEDGRGTVPVPTREE